MLRWRGGRAAEVVWSTSRSEPSLSAITWQGRVLARSAASSMASGSPSTSRQMAATAGPSSSSEKSALTRRARSANSSAAGPSPSPVTSRTHSTPVPTRRLEVASSVSPRGAGQQVGEQGGGAGQVLEVVQHHQQAPLGQPGLEQVADRAAGVQRHRQGLGHGRGQQVGHLLGVVRLDPGQGHHGGAAGEPGSQPLGRGQSEPGLADPTRPDQRQQPAGLPLDQRDHPGQVGLPPDQVGGVDNREHPISRSATLPLRGAKPRPGGFERAGGEDRRAGGGDRRAGGGDRRAGGGDRRRGGARDGWGRGRRRGCGR